MTALKKKSAGQAALDEIMSTAVRPPKPVVEKGVLRSTVTYYSRNNTQWWRVTIQRGPIVTKSRFGTEAEAVKFLKANVVRAPRKIVWIVSPYDLDKY